MTKIECLEKEVGKLSPWELKTFRHWFAEFDGELWDKELERDVAAGKLDRLADEAVAAHRRGEGRVGASPRPLVFRGPRHPIKKWRAP